MTVLEILEGAIADNPTPGPWYAWSSEVSEVVDSHGVWAAGGTVKVASTMTAADAVYIAACSPDVVAKLLAEIERLKGNP